MAHGEDRFTLPELFSRLEATAFGDLDGDLSADRRALQRLLLRHLSGLVLDPDKDSPPEASQLAAWALRSIRTRIDDALAREIARDGYTTAHLFDLSARAGKTLEAGIELPAG